MAGGRVGKTLSDNEVAILRQAEMAAHGAQQMGISVMEAPAQPSHETFLPITGLPSNGMFYKDQMFGQPLKVEDILLIQSVNEYNYYQNFTEIFARRIKGVPPGEILLVDEVFMTYWLRANSFPVSYKLSTEGFTCEHCKHEASADEDGFTFTDMKFTIRNFEALQQKYNRSGVMEFTLPSGLSGKMHIRRRKHLARTQSILKRDYYDYGKEPTAEDAKLLNKLSCIDLGESDLIDTMNLVKTLSPFDYMQLDTIIAENSLISDVIIDYACAKCQAVTPIKGYSFRPDKFLPKVTG